MTHQRELTKVRADAKAAKQEANVEEQRRREEGEAAREVQEEAAATTEMAEGTHTADPVA